jgi:hypothetical protein
MFTLAKSIRSAPSLHVKRRSRLDDLRMPGHPTTLPTHAFLSTLFSDLPIPTTHPRRAACTLRVNAGPVSHTTFSFVHGGLTPSYPNLQIFLSATKNLSAWLLCRLRSHEAHLHSSDGPLLYRGLAEERYARTWTRSRRRRVHVGW